jgi:hypothetical protein
MAGVSQRMKDFIQLQKEYVQNADASARERGIAPNYSDIANNIARQFRNTMKGEDRRALQKFEIELEKQAERNGAIGFRRYGAFEARGAPPPVVPPVYGYARLPPDGGDSSSSDDDDGTGPRPRRRGPVAPAAVTAGPKLQLQVTLLRNVPPVNPKTVPVGTLDLGLDQFVYVVAESYGNGVHWLRLPVSRQAAGLLALKGLLPGSPAGITSTKKKPVLKHVYSMLPEYVASV